MRTYYILLTGFFAIAFWFSCATNLKARTDMSTGGVQAATFVPLPAVPEPIVTVDTTEFVVSSKVKHIYVSPEVWRSTLYRYGKDIRHCKQILDTVIALNETTYQVIMQASPDDMP